MENIILFVSVLLAYFVKAVTGFANTLVMGSLFSFVVANRVTTPIDLIFSIPTNIFIVWRERKSIDWKVVIPLSLLVLVGIFPGTYLLKIGSDWLLKSILGFVLIGLAIDMLRSKPQTDDTRKLNIPVLAIIGIVSGMLAGMYGISALLVVYMARKTDNKTAFRGNLCAVFLSDNLFRLILYLKTDILNIDVFLMSLMLSPALVIGMFIGVKADKHLKDSTVRKAVVYLLIVSGAILVVKNLLMHN